MVEPGSARRVAWQGVLLIALASACAISPLFFGFYDLSIWGPLELVVLAAALGVAVAAPAAPPTRALIALASLIALAAWAWLSRGWGESVDAAVTEANRWALYAATFGVLIGLLRRRADATLLLGTVAAGVAAIGLYVVARMAFGDGPGMFLAGRLNEPLGYVNGQAGFFLLGIWPLVALAEREQPLAAAAGMAGATLLTCLLVLSQSRGVALAASVTAAIVVLAVPGRRRRLWALVVIAGALALTLGRLTEVYDAALSAGGPSQDVTRTAAGGIALAVALAGVVWGIAVAAAGAIAARGPQVAAPWRAAAIWGLVAIIAAVALVGLSRAGRIAHTARVQYDSFVHLGQRQTGDSRFLSGAGNRYDYWRIALHEFDDKPLRGVGAGNYDVGYFLRRQTTEDVRQPHSLALQTLAELGLVGAGLLAALLGAIVVGATGVLRAAREDPWARFSAVGAGGLVTAWIVHTDVDWLHLIPGVTGMALGGAAILLRPWENVRPVGRNLRGAILAVVAALVAVAAVSVARPVVAKHRVTEGRRELSLDARQALAKADDALALNPDSVPAYYLKAAAYARRDQYLPARAALLQATRREPHDFVTWALLGDLASRRGDRALAVRYYRRAVELNPRDRVLAAELRRARGGG